MPIIIKGEGKKSASDILKEKIPEMIKEKQLKAYENLPFSADGFKSEKTPIQPDGKPIIVPEASLIKTELEIVKELKYTEKELKKMNKKQQTDLIKELDPTAKIPKLEKDRIKLILKLIGGK